MEKLKFIGRGSAFNVDELNNSAYIKKDGVMLLIDCGESIAREIIKKNLLYGVEKLYIMITHFHPDHAGSLGTLIFHCKYNLNMIPTIYYPDPEALRGFLMYQGLIHLDDYLYIDFDCHMPKELTESLDIKSIFKTTADHDKISKVEKLMREDLLVDAKTKDIFKAYAYVLKSNDDSMIYYSGDNCNIPTTSFLERCGAIYQDTTLADYSGNIHLSLRELCEKVPEELRHKVYCMHINSKKLIEEAKAKGFNVVEVEE